MRKWAQIHRHDQIFPAILDSAPKEVGLVDPGGRLFQQIRIAMGGHAVEKSTCIRSWVGYFDILVRSLGHCHVASHVASQRMQ